MIRSKKQRGIGVRNYRSAQQAAIVSRAYRMWGQNGIWSEWMGARYIRGRPLSQIAKKQGDSANWKAAFLQKESILKCAELGPNYTKAWTGKGNGISSKNIKATLNPAPPTYELARGIWASKIGKVSLNLWRVRWRNLPTKDRLIRRGMNLSPECELCKNAQETIDHVFSTCAYTKCIINEAMEAARAIVKLEAATNFEGAATELNKLTKGSPTWGLHWSIYGITLFFIWKHRNLRRMKAKSDTERVILRQIIHTTEIGFDESKFKRRTMTASVAPVRRVADAHP